MASSLAMENIFNILQDFLRLLDTSHRPIQFSRDMLLFYQMHSAPTPIKNGERDAFLVSIQNTNPGFWATFLNGV
jgi:hypothetical protein